ncbi:MAG TPA: MgtC/SapB family protein [Bryobacteraceae bacterium]|jgi:uncharacterized membrane protein (DUF4010 family)|nr:MgtC/SapB family protein [Bryobacteraceae bacterium]
MPTKFYRFIPLEGIKIVLVLFLSFLTGLEREEHRLEDQRYSFGGVRTFPLIGLIGYGVSLVSGGQVLPVAIGFAVVAAFLMLSYWHKLSVYKFPGVTSEMSGLTTYLIGALVYREQFWIATTVAVASMLLLELKSGLEGLTEKFPPEEVLTFTKFLLLTAVILPVLPNMQFGPFQLNPFKAWLAVVAVSAISYASYVIQKLTKSHGGIVLASLLGGAYSSTVTTVVLAKRAARENQPHLFAGATLMASSMMYLRLAILVLLFNKSLIRSLGPPFVTLAATGLLVGWLWTKRRDVNAEKAKREYEPKNPLELRAAFLFALLFVVMLVVTHLVVTYLGSAGVYSLAAVMGFTDVDPFIMGMTQSAGANTPLAVASAAILIAAASNNLIKGVYAYMWSDRPTGKQSLSLLIGLAVAGLIPIFWILR